MNSETGGWQLIDPTDAHVLPSKPLSTRKDKGESMPPPSRAPTKRTRVVLSEEEYLDALGHLVERDYYPDNVVMRRQLDLLDGRSEIGANAQGGRRSVRLTDIRRMEFEDIDYTQASEADRAALDMSIDDFFCKYTSEDNDSFEKIREKDLKEFKKKFHWVYEPSDPGQAAGFLMLYHMGGRELSGEERRRMDSLLEGRRMIGDERPNQVNTWKFKVRNNLLFPPELEHHCSTSEPDEQRLLTAASNGGGGGETLLLTGGTDMHAMVSALPGSKRHASAIHNDRVGAAPIGEKSILRANTRLIVPDRFRGSGPSPLEFPHTPTTVSSSMETESVDSWASEAVPSSGYKQYRPVSMTPSPMPGSDMGVMANSLMTWGTVFGTPVAISEPSLDGPLNYRPSKGNNSDNMDDLSDTSSRFQIASESPRERLSRELDKRVRKKVKHTLYNGSSVNLRDKEAEADTCIGRIPHSSRRGTVSMSPAAVALAQRLSGASTANKGGGLTAAMATGLRDAYSRSGSTPHRRSNISSSVAIAAGRRRFGGSQNTGTPKMFNSTPVQILIGGKSAEQMSDNITNHHPPNIIRRSVASTSGSSVAASGSSGGLTDQLLKL